MLFIFLPFDVFLFHALLILNFKKVKRSLLQEKESYFLSWRKNNRIKIFCCLPQWVICLSLARLWSGFEDPYFISNKCCRFLVSVGLMTNIDEMEGRSACFIYPVVERSYSFWKLSTGCRVYRTQYITFIKRGSFLSHLLKVFLLCECKAIITDDYL